jgi:PAS domain S-box-containing protein
MAVAHPNGLAELLAVGGSLDCAFQCLNEGIVVIDPDLRLTYCNGRYFQETGYTPEELIGGPIGTLVGGDSYRELTIERARAALTGIESKFQIPVIRKDGSEVWAEVRAGPFRDMNGSILGIVAACSNATQTVQVQTDMRRAIQGGANELEAAIQLLKKEIEERQVAERVARSQNKVLCDVLDALIATPDLGAFLEMLLRAINENLQSPSSALWMRVDGGNQAQLHTTFPDRPAHHLKQNLDMDSQAVRNLFVKHVPYVVDVPRRRHTLPKGVQDMYDSLGVKATLTVPVMRAEEAIGFIAIRRHDRFSFSESEVEVATALADIAALAIELKRLADKSKIAAILEERNRFAREIHDTMAQGFTGIMLHASAAKQSMMQGYPGAASEHLSQVRALASEGLAEARRSVFALRAAVLEEGNLGSALDALAKRVRVPKMQVKTRVEGRLFAVQPDIEANLLRIAQEATGNAVRHSGANRINLMLKFESPALRLTITDNGHGFDVDSVPKGFGIAGMRERAEASGFQFHIESSANGTVVSVFSEDAAVGGQS